MLKFARLINRKGCQKSTNLSGSSLTLYVDDDLKSDQLMRSSIGDGGSQMRLYVGGLPPSRNDQQVPGFHGTIKDIAIFDHW